MAVGVGRRQFISVLGGAAAWPLAASAQQPGKPPTIGVLGAATPSVWNQYVTAFERRLHELGWIEGRTVAFEYRWAEGRPDRYAEIAAEFVRLKVNVIVTSGSAVLATKQATAVIPIVFARTRHGRDVWYVRREGHRIRLRSKYGTPEFEAEYRAALSGMPVCDDGPREGTLAWLIDRYRETTAWTALSHATRRQRENIFRQVLQSAGEQPFAKITTATIVEGRERRAKTPFQARHFLDAMRGLFRWAFYAGTVKIDPTASVKNPSRKKGAGFIPWTEDHVAAYEACWPIGTRQRVWLDLLLCTGLRRGDAVRLGRQHVRDGIATLKTEKGGFTVTVTLPILPVFSATLAKGPCGELTFICGANGTPLTKEAFGNEFRAACRAAGVPGSAHGVRKIVATRAANRGATVAQLEAIFGWQGGAMASLYTREADRRRLALEAMHKIDANDERTSIVAPLYQVRHSEKKDQ